MRDSGSSVVAVIQARMGSGRFPGKMLERLGSHTLMEWVLLRVKRAARIHQTILAIPETSADQPLADVAAQQGVPVFSGSEQDVLARFAGAVSSTNATHVVRVCADNPLIDPGELDRLVEACSATGCDYACNHQERMGNRYADGFGAEMLTRALLEWMHENVHDTRLREHVTLHLWEHPGTCTLHAVPAPEELAFPELRFDVDTPDDLQRLQHLVAQGITPDTPAAEIVLLARRLWGDT